MRVDVSEVKTYRECKRKHLYSSRNRYHLQPCTPNDNLIFGTQFHEVLAMMYLGTDIDKILEWVNKEVDDPDAKRMMNTMTLGYYDGPYQEDKDKYIVVDIEKYFEYPVGIINTDDKMHDFAFAKEGDKWIAIMADGEVVEAVTACGSIDMICIEVETGRMVGFEHKTAKNFRPEVYNIVDEQPRLYSWALKQILADYHDAGKYLEVKETGPILVNQVKKLLTRFAHERVACQYSDEDLENFMQAFCDTAMGIAKGSAIKELPEPGYMKCQMCDYANLCMHYGYENVQLDDIEEEFEDEYVVRDHDHLDEKAQRHND